MEGSRQSKFNETLDANKLSLVISLYDNAIEMDPKETSFYCLRSFCYSESGSFQPALEDSERVIKDWDRRPEGWFLKEKALAGLRRYLEAAEAEKKVTAFNARNSQDEHVDIDRTIRQKLVRDITVVSAGKGIDFDNLHKTSNRTESKADGDNKSSSNKRSSSRSSRSSRDRNGHGDEDKTKKLKLVPKQEPKRESKNDSRSDSVTNNYTPDLNNNSKHAVSIVSPSSSLVTKIVNKIIRSNSFSNTIKSPDAESIEEGQVTPVRQEKTDNEFRTMDSTYSIDVDDDFGLHDRNNNTKTASLDNIVIHERMSSRGTSCSPSRGIGSPKRRMKSKSLERTCSRRSNRPASSSRPTKTEKRRSIRSPSPHTPPHSPPRTKKRSISPRTPPYPPPGFTPGRRVIRSPSPSPRKELPINIYRFTAIRIRNIYPNVQLKYLESMCMRFGKIVKIEVNDREAVVTYHDQEAPRRAIASLNGSFVPRVSNFSDRLIVRFALGSNQDQFHMRNVRKVGSDECHFYRTTGCPDPDCPEKHIPGNQAIDLMPWMKGGRF